jgi:DNA-binding protein
MGKNITAIPKAPFGRILMKAGAKRVSADSVDAFAEVVTEMAEKIATQAVKLAKHAGRKTVTDEDIELVAKQG